MTHHEYRKRRRVKAPPTASSAGFTLLELMIAVAVIGILAAIAYPSYVNSVIKSRRGAAKACLMDYATHMERYYTTNMRYTKADASAPDLPAIDCASNANTGTYYTYSFSGTPTATTFTLRAQPQGVQATKDAGCGTLTITHAGARGVSGSDGVAKCW